MNSDIDTKTIAKIVGRIKAATGKPIDEDKLSIVLSNSLRQLKEQNAEKYLDVIKDLSNKLEEMAGEIGKLQAQK
jgi:chromosome segregation and condensation protein ScpB